VALLRCARYSDGPIASCCCSPGSPPSRAVGRAAPAGPMWSVPSRGGGDTGGWREAIQSRGVREGHRRCRHEHVKTAAAKTGTTRQWRERGGRSPCFWSVLWLLVFFCSAQRRIGAGVGGPICPVERRPSPGTLPMAASLACSRVALAWGSNASSGPTTAWWPNRSPDRWTAPFPPLKQPGARQAHGVGVRSWSCTGDGVRPSTAVRGCDPGSQRYGGIDSGPCGGGWATGPRSAVVESDARLGRRASASGVRHMRLRGG
jgi:hypothetical protein